MNGDGGRMGALFYPDGRGNGERRVAGAGQAPPWITGFGSAIIGDCFRRASCREPSRCPCIGGASRPRGRTLFGFGAGIDRGRGTMGKSGRPGGENSFFGNGGRLQGPENPRVLRDNGPSTGARDMCKRYVKYSGLGENVWTSGPECAIISKCRREMILLETYSCASSSAG